MSSGSQSCVVDTCEITRLWREMCLIYWCAVVSWMHRGDPHWYTLLFSPGKYISRHKLKEQESRLNKDVPNHRRCQYPSVEPKYKSTSDK
jgi:hypothetical protein